MTNKLLIILMFVFAVACANAPVDRSSAQSTDHSNAPEGYWVDGRSMNR